MNTNRKIKIAYLITGLNVGGAEANLRDLAAGLDKDDFDVVIISTLPVGRIGSEMLAKGVRVVDISGAFKYDVRMFFRHCAYATFSCGHFRADGKACRADSGARDKPSEYDIWRQFSRDRSCRYEESERSMDRGFRHGFEKRRK